MPELVILPKLEIAPELVIVTPDGIVIVIPEGITTVSAAVMDIGGAAPPHVVESFQSPL